MMCFGTTDPWHWICLLEKNSNNAILFELMMCSCAMCIRMNVDVNKVANSTQAAASIKNGMREKTTTTTTSATAIHKPNNKLSANYNSYQIYGWFRIPSKRYANWYESSNEWHTWACTRSVGMREKNERTEHVVWNNVQQHWKPHYWNTQNAKEKKGEWQVLETSYALYIVHALADTARQPSLHTFLMKPSAVYPNACLHAETLYACKSHKLNKMIICLVCFIWVVLFCCWCHYCAVAGE